MQLVMSQVVVTNVHRLALVGVLERERERMSYTEVKGKSNMLVKKKCRKMSGNENIRETSGNKKTHKNANRIQINQ